MKRSIIIFDAIFVLLNISSPYTLIPCFLFSKQIGMNSAIIFVLTFLYILYRFGDKIKVAKDGLFVVFLTINLYNLINAAAQGTLAIGFVATFLANSTFYLLLYNIYVDYRRASPFEKSVSILTTGYVWLCLYQLFIVAIFFILIRSHLINPQLNNITWDYDIFADNASRYYSPVRYFIPYNICIICKESIDRLPFMGLDGFTPVGMFHEPHTMTYYIVPFLFLAHYMYSKKKLVLIDALFVLYMLVAASTTNIICILAVLLLWSIINRKTTLIFYMLIANVAITYIQTMDNQLSELIRFKLDSGSMEYSQGTLSFAFTPQTFWGSNFFDKSYLESGGMSDVGYIVFVLNIVFLLIFIYKTARLCFSSNDLSKYVGLFAAYFILHSAKTNLRTYSLEMLMFVVFLVTICYKEINVKQYAKKN